MMKIREHKYASSNEQSKSTLAVTEQQSVIMLALNCQRYRYSILGTTAETRKDEQKRKVDLFDVSDGLAPQTNLLFFFFRSGTW